MENKQVKDVRDIDVVNMQVVIVPVEYLYRYDNDLTQEDFNFEMGPVLHRYKVKKITPSGYWISKFAEPLSNLSAERKWVSNSSKKRFAYPNEKEALDGFKHRKLREIAIHKSYLKRAKAHLNWAMAQS